MAILLSAPCQTAQEQPNKQPPQDPIIYTITRNAEENGYSLLVRMDVTFPPNTSSFEIKMPVWSPGDYRVVNHAKYVQNFGVYMDNAGTQFPLTVVKRDANTWNIALNGARKCIITYKLNNLPAGIFSENHVSKEKYTFYNGPSVYVYVEGQKERPALLRLLMEKGWKSEVPLPTRKYGQETLYYASDYDTLTDSPVLMADAKSYLAEEFTVQGKPHRAVFFGNIPETLKSANYVPVLKPIVQASNDLMGSTPYDQYIFFFDVGGRGGGLEHLNSTRINLPAGVLPRNVATFFAHEFFHLWNIKRIRPRVLGPFDYIQPPKTANLWFAEGVTDYYAYIICLRAGVLSEREFLAHWRNSIRQMQFTPGRKKVSADVSSLRVWEADNSTGYELSYYQKGALIGLCLDLKIRDVTDGKKSLDDVMRLLMKEHNPPLPGFEEDGILQAINRVTGKDLTEFYNLVARSTEEMPFDECLRYVGLTQDTRPLANATERQLRLQKEWFAGDAKKPVAAKP